MLYSIFINDISEVTRDYECKDQTHQDVSKLFGNACSKCGTITTYADDSTYVVACKKRDENEIKLKTTLWRIRKYLLENELNMNIAKTTLLECMLPQKRGKNTGSPHLILTLRLTLEKTRE